VSVTPRRLVELDPRHRRRAVIRTGLTVGVAWVVLFGIYYLEPVVRYDNAAAIVRLVVGLSLLGVVLALQTRRITNAELPELRAAEALGLIIPLFLLAFSTLYLSLSHGTARTFNQPLDHTSALYFTVTVFSTVGFGDIVARDDTGRLVVIVQMVLDLVIVGVVVRLLLNAAKTGLGRAEGGAPE